MESHERQYVADNLARSLAVMEQVEGVWSRGVIYESNRQIARQGFGQEMVDRFVQVRHLILARAYDEQRRGLRKIID